MVKPAVNGPQGAQVLAEGPEHLHGEQHDSKQDAQLPEKQPAGLVPQRLVYAEQRKRAEAVDMMKHIAAAWDIDAEEVFGRADE